MQSVLAQEKKFVFVLVERFLVLIFIFILITTTLAAIYDQFYLIKKHSDQ